MYKKIIIMLMLLLPCVVKAQLATGEWYNYPVYNENNINASFRMVEAKDGMLYYTSAGNLFSYNKKNDETYSYSKRNRLSENDTIGIVKYNYDKDYLLAAYGNCNIDLLYADGKTVNLSDINDAIMTADKKINDVCFYKGRIYVATSFGFVVFDEKTRSVVESANYGINVKNIAVYKDTIIFTDESYIYWTPVNTNHISFDSCTKFNGSLNLKKFFMLGDDDNYLYALNNNTVLRRYRFDYPTNRFFSEDIALDFTPVKGWVYSDGNLYVCDANNSQMACVKNGAVVSTRSIGNSFEGATVTGYSSPDYLWVLDRKKGIGCYDVTTSTPTAIIEPKVPDACNLDVVAYLTPSYDNKRIYAHNLGPSRYKREISDEGFTFQGVVGKITEGNIINVTPDPVSGNSITTAVQDEYGTKIVAPAHLAEDKADPSIYYIGGTTEGVYKIKDGVEIGKYTPDNSPMESTWAGPRPFCLQVDRGGNLWVVASTGSMQQLKIYVLPFEKTQLPTDQVKAEDWLLIHSWDESAFFMDIEILVCQKSNMMFFLKGNYNTVLMAYDTKGTFNDFSDDELLDFRSFVDQDGNEYKVYQCYALTEDLNGHVWVAGNATGVMEITDPSEVISNPDMRINRVKIPRNDGTGYSDPLFATENVYSIAVDNQNRKWIGTCESGLYIISPKGDKILEHYTTDNSLLPDNRILAVRPDMYSNRVYIGTLHGLTLFNTVAAASADNYDEVSIFPNPIRPDYTGWLTLSGLMDKSNVKVCDTTGKVVFNGQSDGGTLMWDGCDMDGNRVKSGVYSVYASQSAVEPGADPVVKLYVVN